MKTTKRLMISGAMLASVSAPAGAQTWLYGHGPGGLPPAMYQPVVPSAPSFPAFSVPAPVQVPQYRGYVPSSPPLRHGWGPPAPPAAYDED